MAKKIYIPTADELDLMRQSGRISAQALKLAIESVHEGQSLEEIDKLVENKIKELGGGSSFKTVPGYNWTCCLTVNEEVVHGIPRPIILKAGDVLSIDMGTVYQGWHTDTAWSVIVPGSKEDLSKKERFLKIGEKSLWAAIDQAKAGNRIGDISAAMQEVIETEGGYKVIRSLVGHGVGRQLHDDPEIPGFGFKGTGEVLVEGMTIAIEAIYTESTQEVVLDDDGWTLVSDDGSLGGMFEMSVIVGKDGPEVLTDWRHIS